MHRLYNDASLDFSFPRILKLNCADVFPEAVPDCCPSVPDFAEFRPSSPVMNAHRWMSLVMEVVLQWTPKYLLSFFPHYWMTVHRCIFLYWTSVSTAMIRLVVRSSHRWQTVLLPTVLAVRRSLLKCNCEVFLHTKWGAASQYQHYTALQKCETLKRLKFIRHLKFHSPKVDVTVTVGQLVRIQNAYSVLSQLSKCYN